MTKKCVWAITGFLILSVLSFCPCVHALDSQIALSKTVETSASDCHHEGASENEESECCGQCGAHWIADFQARNHEIGKSSANAAYASLLLPIESQVISSLLNPVKKQIEGYDLPPPVHKLPVYILHEAFLI